MWELESPAASAQRPPDDKPVASPASAAGEPLLRGLPLMPVHAELRFEVPASCQRRLPPVLCALLWVLASILVLLPFYLRLASAAQDTPASKIDNQLDAELDAGVDNGLDNGVDAGLDAKIDARLDNRVDTGLGNGVDAGLDNRLDNREAESTPLKAEAAIARPLPVVVPEDLPATKALDRASIRDPLLNPGPNPGPNPGSIPSPEDPRAPAETVAASLNPKDEVAMGDGPMLLKSPPGEHGESIGWVQIAYQDYRRGALEHAERSYRYALATGTHRRDALLGLAAIAQRRGQLAQARDFYRRLLKEWPEDSTARAALLNLAPPGSGSVLQEFAAQSQPDPYLYFTQGNLYAAQRNWKQAAQLYRQGLRGDRSHPDYLFNLALSLEHLGEAAQALEFYRQALVHSAEREAGFDPAQLAVRIRALESVAGPGR